MDESRRELSAHVVRLDAAARRVMGRAQQLSESYGQNHILSGSLLMAVATTEDDVANRLLRALGATPAELEVAIESQLEERPGALQDQPTTVVSDALKRAVDSVPASREVGVELVLAVILEFPDAMATRIVKDLGKVPIDVALAISSDDWR